MAIAAVDRVLHRALQKNPAQRYESAAAMADDVRAVMRLSESGQIMRAHRLRRLIVLPFRVLRAVVFAASAGFTTLLCSTLIASSRSCWAERRSA